MTSEPIPQQTSSHLVPPRPDNAGTNPTGTSSLVPSPYGEGRGPGTSKTHQLAPTSSPDASHRYDLAPLARAAGITLGQIGGHHTGDPMTGMAALATRLNVGTTTLKRARLNGLTLTQADRWAIRLGLWPHEIWDTWWDDVEGDDPEQALHGAAATNDAKTHCPKGHGYDRTDNTGARRCTRCQADNNRWSRARRKNPTIGAAA